MNVSKKRFDVPVEYVDAHRDISDDDTVYITVGNLGVEYRVTTTSKGIVAHRFSEDGSTKMLFADWYEIIE